MRARMIEFHKNNIKDEWQDLVNEFPHICLEPSEEIIEIFEERKDIDGYPKSLDEYCNLRYGIECPIEWKGIIREFFQEMDDMMKQANENGDDFKYYTFILKEKFRQCVDQGAIFGKDRHKYYHQWCDAGGRLMEKSKKIKLPKYRGFRPKM